ncbi:MAG: hypothetical protein ACTSSJ_05585 [Candidatus Odinarchaeia archaeon]
MVNIPICVFCAQTGILCSSCQEKLSKGEISDLDIKLSKELLSLENKFPALKDVTFYKAIEVGNTIVLMVNSTSMSNVIGVKGKIVRRLEDIFKKRIRVVAKSKNARRIVEDLLAPITILGVNKIFLPTGEMESKIRISKRESQRIPIKPELVEEIVFKLTGERIRISFE